MKINIISIIIISILLSSFMNDKIIIDSDYSFEQAIKGTKAPDSLIKHLVLLDLEYYSTDNLLHRGQIIINKEIEKEIKEIFAIIKEIKYPINKMIPIVKYGWSDDKSMSDNNSSAFNYRFIVGTKRLSNHSFGKALDINPFFNPVIYKSGKVSPKGAVYNPKDTIKVFTANHPIVKAFKERGFRWGGDWNSLKDYHHFDIPALK